MLTGFTWCVPLKTKTADKVVTAYKNHIACPFGGSVKILTDNGLSSRISFSRKLLPSWEQKCLSIHHCTDYRAMEREKDSTGSSKPASQSISTMDWNGMS